MHCLALVTKLRSGNVLSDNDWLTVHFMSKVLDSVKVRALKASSSAANWKVFNVVHFMKG